MELTIAKHLTGCLPRLKHKEDILSTWEEQHPFKPKYQLVDKATYIGLELEIENIPPRFIIDNPYWTVHRDGSLRNNGLEFVTPPIKISRIEQALTVLFNQLQQGYTYGERTSVHVHVNVRTMTLKQLELFVLTYMIFEKALFNWVGHNRDINKLS